MIFIVLGKRAAIKTSHAHDELYILCLNPPFNEKLPTNKTLDRYPPKPLSKSYSQIKMHCLFAILSLLPFATALQTIYLGVDSASGQQGTYIAFFSDSDPCRTYLPNLYIPEYQQE